MRAAWIVPSFIEGSGGHRTILQNIQYMVQCGYECDIYVENKGDVKGNEELYDIVEKFFGACAGNFYLGYNLKTDYDIIFATAWYTAKVVRDLDTKAIKAYFIQDFEALFNPMGDGFLMACNSYCYGLHPITIGRWLSNKMLHEFGVVSQYFDFCADKNVYRTLPNIEKENAVCFIYQPDKPRRCSQVGLEALGIIKFLRPDIKVYLYGSNIKGRVWFEHENLGIISIDECNKLYNKCKVGLCISSSNPSRIPFEMMSSGLPVVDLYMENNLYDMPDSSVTLAHYTPESIAQAILNIINDEDLAKRMSNNGKKYMSEKSLEYGYNQFLQSVNNIINRNIPTKNIEKIYSKPAIFADVIIHKSLQESNYEQNIIHNKSFLDKLKNIRFIRRSKLIKKLWYKIKGI